MNILSFFLLLLYIDLNKAFDEAFLFNSSDIINNITVMERGIAIFLDDFSRPTIPKQPTDHAAIQIVIFAACIIILVLIGLLLCSLCCKHYRRRNELFTRSPSINSIQELIRERLLDRPPSYHESQSSLNTNISESPPAYNEISPNIIVTEPITNSASTLRVPTSPPVYTISSKMSTTYANNDLDLPYTECESDTDSPPSYHISEGVVNPILLHIANNSATENNIESQTQRESQNLSIHSEFYI